MHHVVPTTRRSWCALARCGWDRVDPNGGCGCGHGFGGLNSHRATTTAMVADTPLNRAEYAEAVRTSLQQGYRAWAVLARLFDGWRDRVCCIVGRDDAAGAGLVRQLWVEHVRRPVDLLSRRGNTAGSAALLFRLS
ncbi:MAG: DUF7715 family protein [Pseudonocardiaceae bacterium]